VGKLVDKKVIDKLKGEGSMKKWRKVIFYLKLLGWVCFIDTKNDLSNTFLFLIGIVLLFFTILGFFLPVHWLFVALMEFLYLIVGLIIHFIDKLEYESSFLEN